MIIQLGGRKENDIHSETYYCAHPSTEISALQQKKKLKQTKSTKSINIRISNSKKDDKQKVPLPEIAGARTPILITIQAPNKTRTSRMVFDSLCRSKNLLNNDAGEFLLE